MKTKLFLIAIFIFSTLLTAEVLKKKSALKAIVDHAKNELRKQQKLTA